MIGEQLRNLLENKKIGLKWQIGPKREPIPNPDKASDLNIDFIRKTIQHFRV